MNLLLLATLLQQPQPVVLEAGPLTCEIHISRTANLFHVVDQLSGWSKFCHRQYGSHFKDLDDRDRALLAKHAEIRKVRGWGGGLEQAFYSPLDLEAALAAGIKAGHLTEPEAAVERDVLSHFAARVDTLIADNRKLLDSYPGRLQKEQKRLAEFSERISRLVGGAKITVPVYLIANPHDQDIGGGYNGDRVTIEIPRVRDAVPSLLHELFHAFLQLKKTQLEEAVKGVEGLDYETLNEGLAYAIAPGIIHTGGPNDDPLTATVRRFASSGAGLKDYYYRVNLYGLALRPLMKEALDRRDATIESILPRAVDAWKVTRELASVSGKARSHDYRSDPTPCVFIFGLAPRSFADRLMPGKDRHVFGRGHSAKEYDEMFKNHNKPGDLVVLVIDLAAGDRVPDGDKDPLPKPWSEIEAALKKGESVQLEGEWRKMRTVVLAAPTKETLETMLKKTDLIR